MGTKNGWLRNLLGRLALRSGRGEAARLEELLVDVVLEAGRRRDPSYLLGLELAMGHRDEDIARAAADQFEALLLAVPAERLVDLDAERRSARASVVVHDWVADRYLPERREHRLRRPTPPTGLLLAEATCHDGRRREAALARLGPGRGRAALAVILLRLVDRVPQVRAQAEASLRPYLDLDLAPGELLEGLLPLVLRLADQDRARESEGLALLDARLATDPPRAALVSLATASRNPAPGPLRRAATELLLAAEPGPPEVRSATLGALITAPHLDVARLAAREALSHPDPAERLARARVLWRAPLPPLRRLALGALVGLLHDPAELDALLGEALLDRAGTVRDLARFHLLERLGVARAELAERARAVAFGSGPAARRRAAVTQLGVLGDETDRAPLRALALAPGGGRLAAAALDALARRAPAAEVREACRVALADGGPALVRAATRCLARLSRSAPALEAAEVAELSDPDRPVHVRRAALRLAADLDKWTHLATILAGADGPAPLPRPLLEAALATWERDYNRRWTLPGDLELARLRARLELAAERLDPARLGRLRVLLDEVAERLRRA